MNTLKGIPEPYTTYVSGSDTCYKTSDTASSPSNATQITIHKGIGGMYGISVIDSNAHKADEKKMIELAQSIKKLPSNDTTKDIIDRVKQTKDKIDISIEALDDLLMQMHNTHLNLANSRIKIIEPFIKAFNDSIGEFTKALSIIETSHNAQYKEFHDAMKQYIFREDGVFSNSRMEKTINKLHNDYVKSKNEVKQSFMGDKFLIQSPKFKKLVGYIQLIGMLFRSIILFYASVLQKVSNVDVNAVLHNIFNHLEMLEHSYPPINTPNSTPTGPASNTPTGSANSSTVVKSNASSLKLATPAANLATTAATIATSPLTAMAATPAANSSLTVATAAATSALKFAVGKHGKSYDKEWRMMTEAEWRDPAIQTALVQAHREGGGWTLLEEPLVCNGVLYVANGYVLIDGEHVVEVGFTYSQQLRGVYPAINRGTKVAWTTTAPAPGNNWTVGARDGSNRPCLFVQDPAAAPAPAAKFAVGKYNNNYPGYRKATAADWKNSAFQAELLKAHREGGGWALLEKPLVCNSALYVVEGFAMIDGHFVAEVGYSHSSPQQLRGVYPAMNHYTKVAWTTTAPALGDNWTVGANDGRDRPCLFVQDPAAAPPASSANSAALVAAQSPAKLATTAAAAKNTAEEDAAAKKKAEEDAAAKKKAEEDAAAKKKAEEDAAALKFAVGKHGKSYGKEWHMATAADWKNPAFQAKLLKAHREGGGWALLEEPLVCNNALFVAEGLVLIDEWQIAEVGNTYPYQQLRGVYPAMNNINRVAWTTTAPAPGNNWTISTQKANYNPPCLFVQDPAAAANNVAAALPAPLVAAPLVAAPPAPAAAPISSPAAAIATNAKFAVGMRNKDYGKEWCMATEAEWTNPTFQAALVQAHQEGGGWPLLKEPLNCIGFLHVAEGPVLINSIGVAEVGFNGAQQLRSRYPAMNWSTKVAWTTTAPSADKTWTVAPLLKNVKTFPPCLFVQDPLRIMIESLPYFYKYMRKDRATQIFNIPNKYIICPSKSFPGAYTLNYFNNTLNKLVSYPFKIMNNRLYFIPIDDKTQQIIQITNWNKITFFTTIDDLIKYLKEAKHIKNNEKLDAQAAPYYGVKYFGYLSDTSLKKLLEHIENNPHIKPAIKQEADNAETEEKDKLEEKQLEGKNISASIKYLKDPNETIQDLIGTFKGHGFGNQRRLLIVLGNAEDIADYNGHSTSILPTNSNNEFLSNLFTIDFSNPNTINSYSTPKLYKTVYERFIQDLGRGVERIMFIKSDRGIWKLIFRDQIYRFLPTRENPTGKTTIYMNFSNIMEEITKEVDAYKQSNAGKKAVILFGKSEAAAGYAALPHKGGGGPKRNKTHHKQNRKLKRFTQRR